MLLFQASVSSWARPARAPSFSVIVVAVAAVAVAVVVVVVVVGVGVVALALSSSAVWLFCPQLLHAAAMAGRLF